MRFLKSNSAGMTLLEIIAAITVLGVLTSILVHATAFWSALGNKSQRVLDRQNELQTKLNTILEGFGEYPGLLVAKDYSLAGSSDPCGMADPLQREELSFTLPDDTVITYRYDASDDTLYRQVNSDPETPHITSLSCFSAKESVGNVVLLRLRATVGGVGGDRLVELATQVKPRNM